MPYDPNDRQDRMFAAVCRKFMNEMHTYLQMLAKKNDPYGKHVYNLLFMFEKEYIDFLEAGQQQRRDAMDDNSEEEVAAPAASSSGN